MKACLIVANVAGALVAASPLAGSGQPQVSPALLDVRSGGLTLRAQVWRPSGKGPSCRAVLGKPQALKIYGAFGPDTRTGHNIVFESVRTWESDVFAFLDACLRR